MSAPHPPACGRDWCGSTTLRQVSYGDGKPYFVCPVGHVTPTPPPPDLHAIDDLCDAYDCEGAPDWLADSAMPSTAHEPSDRGAVNLGAITAVFLACLIGTCLLLLAIAGGRSVMCKAHHQGLVYCDGYSAVQK